LDLELIFASKQQKIAQIFLNFKIYTQVATSNVIMSRTKNEEKGKCIMLKGSSTGRKYIHLRLQLFFGNSTRRPAKLNELLCAVLRVPWRYCYVSSERKCRDSHRKCETLSPRRTLSSLTDEDGGMR